MIDVFKKLFILLSARERSRFYVLAILLIFVSLAEVFGVSTVLVLLKVYSEPHVLLDNATLAWAYESLGFTTLFSFQLFVSVAALVVVLISQAVKAGGNYAIIRYSSMRGHAISVRLYQSYLQLPYSWFLENNSADISKSVLAEVQRLVSTILIPSLQLLANSLLAISIIGFLVVLDPVISVTAAGLLGGSYMLIYFGLRGLQIRLGHKALAANKKRFRLTSEATGGIKEVKLLDMEQHYIHRFKGPSLEFANANALSIILRQLPRYALEALTFALLLVVMLFMLLRHDGNLASAIPLLGTFAFAIMRLLPALQQIYTNLSSIRNGKPLLDQIANDFARAEENRKTLVSPQNRQQRMVFSKSLEVRGLGFSYPNTSRPSLLDVNFEIQSKTTVGIVGGTGAGKTTLVDSLLGLLLPDAGDILIDGTPITPENIHSWRRCIGYVPQIIYLTDSTVAENIAFGVTPDNIDMEAIERAAKAASLHEFVMDELAQNYQTIVGERGVRLSGGQRQRIGIARALYHDPELLILDEATSALDNLTERAVMDAVRNIGHEKTIIMIAHRLSTVRACDAIFLMEKGHVAAKGTFDELVEQNENFRKLAAAG